MTNVEAVRQEYLQKAHDRRGDWQMAMLMMAEQILLLNDALACAQIADGADPFAAPLRGNSEAMADHKTHEQEACPALLERVAALEDRLARVEAWAEHQRRRMADEVLRLKMLLLHAQRENRRSQRPLLVGTGVRKGFG